MKSINTLIKPHPKYAEFNRDNIRVHGIKPEMVKEAPEFSALYPELKPYIEEGFVAAHNTAFDVDCLRDVLTIYDMPIPGFEYICTCEIARKMWEGLKNYRLKTVATHLGHKFKHHDAGEDAIASATIIMRAMEQSSVTEIHELAAKIGVKTGTVVKGGEYKLSTIRSLEKKADRIAARSIRPETEKFDKEHPLYGKELVFTGRITREVTRKQAMQMAVNAGAQLSNYIRAQTDYLVQGQGKGTESSKTRSAKKAIEAGGKIKIITEDEFFKLLGA